MYRRFSKVLMATSIPIESGVRFFLTVCSKVYHGQQVMKKYHERLCVGTISDARPRGTRAPGEFGSSVPYAEPIWYQRFTGQSAYYTDSHRAFRERVRAFYDKEVAPTIGDWSESAEG
jgi:hypothetical protein